MGEDLFCPACGYNLRGIDSRNCPECGREFDPATLAMSQIPWVHRKEIGRLKAYFKTLWMLTFHPVRFGEEASRPVCLKSARRFCWVNLALVIVPVLVFFIVATRGPIHNQVYHFLEDWVPAGVVSAIEEQLDRRGWSAAVLLPLEAGLSRSLIVIAALALPFSFTMIPAWLLCPGHVTMPHRNRVDALSRYCSASFVWWAILGNIIAIEYLLIDYLDATGRGWDVEYWWAPVLLGVPSMLVALFCIGAGLACCLSPVAMLRAACRCSGWRISLFALAWPVLNLLAIVGGMLLVTWCLGFFRIVGWSLE